MLNNKKEIKINELSKHDKEEFVKVYAEKKEISEENLKNHIFFIENLKIKGNIKDISIMLDIDPDILYKRLKFGMDIEEAIKIPKNEKLYTVYNFTGTLEEITKFYKNDLVKKVDNKNKNIKHNNPGNENNILKTSYKSNLNECKRNEFIWEYDIKNYLIDGFIGNIKEITDYLGIEFFSIKDKFQTNTTIGNITENPEENIYIIHKFIENNVEKISKNFEVNLIELKEILENQNHIKENINVNKINIKEITKNFKVNLIELKEMLENKEDIEETKITNSEYKNKEFTINGYNGNINQIAKEFNIPIDKVYKIAEKLNMNEKDILFIGIYNINI